MLGIIVVLAIVMAVSSGVRVWRRHTTARALIGYVPVLLAAAFDLEIFSRHWFGGETSSKATFIALVVLVIEIVLAVWTVKRFCDPYIWLNEHERLAARERS